MSHGHPYDETYSHKGEPLGTQIVRMPEVLRMTGLCRTTIWRWTKAGRFPAPVRLGSRHIGWQRSDVEKWINDREAVTVGT